MTDLGRLYSDQCSNAVSINSKSQVVGCSSDCTNCLHPFLWEDGAPMIDLNTFVPPDLDVQLTFAVSINAFVYRLGCSVAYSEASVSKHTDAYSSRARRLGRPSLSVPGGDQIAA